jgi:hypothetical protein
VAKELKHFDISHSPELLHLVAEVRAANAPFVLGKDTEDLAVIRPVTRTGRRTCRGQPLTREDALWKLVGSATSAPPADATKKHEYVALAFTTHHLRSALL